MKQKILLFPCCLNDVSFIKYITKNENFELAAAVSFESRIENFSDISEFDNRNPIGMAISNDFKSEVEKCDIVLIMDDIKNEIVIDDIYANIIFTLKCKKSVICAQKLNDFMIAEIQRIANVYKTEFRYLRGHEEFFSNENKITEPLVPVIFIGSLLKNLNSSEISLILSEELKMKGYKPLVFTTNYNNLIFGHFPLPQFLFENGISEEMKIIQFNSYINHIQKEQKPDLMIIELPNALIRYNERLTFGFGVLPFMISQAVRSDYFILYMQCMITDEYYKMLNDKVYYRFGRAIDAIMMRNIQIDIKEHDELCFNYIKEDEAKRNIELFKKDAPVFNVLNENDIADLATNVLNQLS